MDANTGTNLISDEEALTDNLDETNHDLLERSRDLLAAEARLPEIIDDETSGKAGDYIALIRTAIKAAEGAREKEKSPYLLGGRRVDSYFQRKLITPLDSLRKRVLALQTTYLRKKEEDERAKRDQEVAARRAEERRKQEEAARLAEKAKTEKGLEKAIVAEQAAETATVARHEAEQAAEAKPADLSRVRGDYSTMSLVASWDFKDLDTTKVDLETLRPYLHRNAIETAIRQYLKKFPTDGTPPELIGAEIFLRKQAR